MCGLIPGSSILAHGSTCLFLCQYYAVFVVTAVELEIRYCDTASSILIAHGGFGCLDYFMFLYDAFFWRQGITMWL